MEDLFFLMNHSTRENEKGEAMKNKWTAATLTATLLVSLFAGCGAQTAETETKVEGTVVENGAAAEEVSASDVKKGRQTEAVSCHDPQIIIGKDGKYYMFGSHTVGVKSDTLSGWEYFANGNNLFSDIYSGDLEAFSFVGKNTDGGYSIWASNVVYNEAMGKYVMYFCTTSSYIKSNLCMAVADEVEGPYSYVDTILYSGYGKSDADQTNLYEVLGEDADISRYLEYGGYNNKQWPNCIDPAVFTDADGRMWMTYGSWSGGIFILELDPTTGYPIYPEADEANGVDPYYGTHLIGGGHHSVEGPYIDYNEESGYYYLFVSYGGLQSDGGYQIRQYRSENPDGPYVDASGKTLLDEEDHYNYGVKMMGNYTFPSLDCTYMAPGGQSTFVGTDGNRYITYHQRFDDGTEYHEPRVHQMFLNEDGWYVATPFATMGETLKAEGYTKADVSGTFYVVNHGTDVSAKVREAEEFAFAEDGSIAGAEISGSYQVKDGTDFIEIELDGKTYQGVIVEMNDEAGNPILAISATGESNETIWCVKYLN